VTNTQRDYEDDPAVQVTDGIPLDRESITIEDKTEVECPDCGCEHKLNEEGIDIRFYYDVRNESIRFPSVTSVTGFRHDPEKDASLRGWKGFRDGREGTGYNWKDIRNYKGWRGTLAHYAILNEFADEELYGDEEAEAEEKVASFGNYQGDDAKMKCLREVSWVTNEFDELEETELDLHEILQVETFVLNEEIGYGGQYDLLHERSDGTVVLSDVKTSKLKLTATGNLTAQSRDKLGGYAMQLSAYANAIDRPIDECQIIWMCPDRKNSKIVHEGDWERTRESYFREYAGIAERLNQETLAEYLD
jgi:hypothetical protein